LLGGKLMVKLSKKRTCEGCKALDMRQYVSECILGYKIDDNFKPTEPCLKPKTYSEFIECNKLIERK
jgi:hypothetical protein